MVSPFVVADPAKRCPAVNFHARTALALDVRRARPLDFGVFIDFMSTFPFDIVTTGGCNLSACCQCVCDAHGGLGGAHTRTPSAHRGHLL